MGLFIRNEYEEDRYKEREEKRREGKRMKTTIFILSKRVHVGNKIFFLQL